MQDSFVIHYSWLIPLLPLVGAVIAGFFGARWLKQNSHWPIWIGVGISAVLSLTLLFVTIGAEPEAGQPGLGVREHLFTWFETGDPAADEPYKRGVEQWPEYFRADAGFWFDPLTAVMLSVVCGIGFLITVFAAGYMKGEEGYFRFFAYLGLFIFMMTLLVMGDNLVMLYLGWEGVGLCSYLLIGYYYDKPAAREAAKKAFLVNRVGDFGFGLGIMLCFLAFGTVSYFGAGIGGTDGLLERAAADPGHWALNIIPFLLMLGAFGKSAQFPLYVWLPDAMEGPTPVSALIHAATMVTAGVYMIARCGTLFVTNEAAMYTIVAIGAFTAIFAATIALRQFDLKKVFAYSTVSQLGFMFVGVGALAPVAGVFHLVTHAFFKALLFLSSGVVMHAMLGHLDLRRMSGLKHVMPKTRWLMLTGCLALAGVPIFSGFFSKDEIVASAFHVGPLWGAILLVTAFLTAYYTFRLYFRVFEGPQVVPTEPAEGHHGGGGHDHAHGAHGGMHEHTPEAHASHTAVATGTMATSGVDRAPAHGTSGHAHGGGHDHGHHDHEPSVMILPLMVLAVGAVLAGFLNFPTHSLGHFLGESPSFSLAWDQAHKYYSGRTDVPSPDPAMFGQTVEGHPAEIHWGVMFISAVVAVAGIALAYWLHLRDRRMGDAIPERTAALSRILEAKYGIDEIYQALIVEPLRMLGRALFAMDRLIVDGLVGLVGYFPMLPGLVLRKGVQRGYLQGYAAVMLFGVAVILLLVFL